MLEIEWSYEGKLKHIVIDMSKYIPNTLTKFQHIPSAKPQYTLAHHTLSTCRVKIQYVQLEDEQEEILSDKSVKYIQAVISTLLYYACALDNIILIALSDLVSE